MVRPPHSIGINDKFDPTRSLFKLGPNSGVSYNISLADSWSSSPNPAMTYIFANKGASNKTILYKCSDGNIKEVIVEQNKKAVFVCMENNMNEYVFYCETSAVPQRDPGQGGGVITTEETLTLWANVSEIKNGIDPNGVPCVAVNNSVWYDANDVLGNNIKIIMLHTAGNNMNECGIYNMPVDQIRTFQITASIVNSTNMKFSKHSSPGNGNVSINVGKQQPKLVLITNDYLMYYNAGGGGQMT
jgi:hypothetical protein